MTTDNLGKVSLPKKIFRVKELTFVLPDDFEGTIDDAFACLLEYRKQPHEPYKLFDKDGLFSTLEVLVHGEGSPRCCGEYGIYVLGPDGCYKVEQGSVPDGKDISTDE